MKTVIVGGGVIGLCCAYELAKRGVSVLVLDENREAADSCSTGNAGMIVPSHFVPLAAPGMALTGLKMLRNPKSPFSFALRPDMTLLKWSMRFLKASNRAQADAAGPVLRDLNLESRRMYLAYQEELGGIGLETKGLLMICEQRDTLDAEAHHAEKATKLGLKTKVLDPAALEHVEPRAGYRAAGAVLFEDDAHFQPTLLLAGLRRRIQELGGEIRSGARVVGFTTAGKQVQAVRLEHEEIAAGQVVLAGGVGSRGLAKQLGHDVPVVAGKGYSFTVEEPAVTLDLCSILCEARVAITPMGSGIRFAGTMELGAEDDRINAAKVMGIRESVSRVIPGVPMQTTEKLPIWQGKRPCSPDGLPLIGRSKRWENLTIAAGHAMMGMSLAPVTGKLVSQLMLDGSADLWTPQLNPNRFE